MLILSHAICLSFSFFSPGVLAHSSCLAGQGNAPPTKLVSAFLQTYVFFLTLKRAAVSQGRDHHRRRQETRIVKAGRLLTRHALAEYTASLPTKNRH